MKNMLKAMAAIVLLTALGGVSRSQASTAYTNSALNGCYGFLSNSVGIVPPLNRSTVGTICFDGLGSIVPIAGTLDQTGWYQNTNGTAVAAANVAGGYAVTNVPGQGMGTFGFKGVCGVYAFSINSVDSAGIAHGFQFSLISSKGCQRSPNVIGGTAYLQP
jgi:hypothetical protein